ncbi:MAG: CopG family transcriptional regulator [Acidobacteriota bacterium]
MRTTLDVDEDVLQAAKEIAALRKTTTGKVLSELARKGLTPRAVKVVVRNGVPLLPPRRGERSVTVDHVNRLRDEDPGRRVP